MLSRTAESLFWMGRYIERADKTARMLEVGHRLALVPRVDGGFHNEWESILSVDGSAGAYRARFGDVPNQRDCESWLFFDRENPSSVASCMDQARANARAVRTALTSEMWDAVNGAYLEFAELERMPRGRDRLPVLTDWTKKQCALFRGTTESTHLQNDGYDFLQLGIYVERADNTARMLDVKYYVLLPTIDMVGGGVDRLQWATLLRSLSALRAFHWAYGGEQSPAKIAHFLILNPSCPRSLLHCTQKASDRLASLAHAYGHRGRAHDRVTLTLSDLAEADIADVIAGGLHEFLTGFIGNNAALSLAIGDTYLFGGR
jgi:uncharacterized alpha-E superfamily protein